MAKWRRRDPEPETDVLEEYRIRLEAGAEDRKRATPGAPPPLPSADRARGPDRRFATAGSTASAQGETS